MEEFALKESIAAFVVGAIAVNKGKVLILKRKAEDDFLPGLWELPSGKVEEGEDLMEALEREVEEETGQRIKKVIAYVGHFDYLSKSGKKMRQFNWIVELEDPENLTLTEHSEFAWVGLDELERFNMSEEIREAIRRFFNNS